MITKVWNPYLDEYMLADSRVLSSYRQKHHGSSSKKTKTGGDKRDCSNYKSCRQDTKDNDSFSSLLQAFTIRDKCLKQYAFAIPNSEAIETLVHYGPVVEIGCGLGYWAKLVQNAGGDILPYDINVDKNGMVKLYMSDEYVKPYTMVYTGGVEAAELHSERAMFLCWPPYDTPMAYECLKTYLQHGGTTLIYVGEGAGGCTGDARFHNLLEERMELVRTVKIPVWPAVHDYMSVYTLKSA